VPDLRMYVGSCGRGRGEEGKKERCESRVQRGRREARDPREEEKKRSHLLCKASYGLLSSGAGRAPLLRESREPPQMGR